MVEKVTAIAPDDLPPEVDLPPDSPVYVGPEDADPTFARVMVYSDTYWDEHALKTMAACPPPREGVVTWIHVTGLKNGELVAELCERFGMHPLIHEDILDGNQRPKLEDLDDYLYVVMRILGSNAEGRVQDQQLSLALGRDFVLSFQEEPGGPFGRIADRLRSGWGRIRRLGADHLAYALVDAVVDDYFGLLERLDDRIEALEDTLLADADHVTLGLLSDLRTDLIYLRKGIWPLREVIGNLIHAHTDLINEVTRPYLRDVYDHEVQAIDTVEIMRDLVSNLHDIYLSSVSNRLNEVMKVLTIISTIFIPLTFIAGVYGMNFRYMPELMTPWGYPLTWLVMIAIAVTMLLFFKRRRWW
ncbi:MAG: magnesium/cobalt transporter CorA [Chloroflexota bacterium]